MQLRLLGSPQAWVNQSWQSLAPERPTWLLVYLALCPDWVSRDSLAELFSPHAPEEQAKAALRLLLHRAKKLPWASNVQAQPLRLRWMVHTDVQAFETAVRENDWQRAVELYRGPLLEGWPLAPSGLQDGLEAERERLAALWHRAVLRLVELKAEGALEVLERVLAQEFPPEEALQAYLRLAPRERALMQYQRFAHLLQEAFGLEPLATTQALAQSLRASQPHLLPQSTTALVGRQKELQAVLQHLQQPNCRLLTLVGLGGMGKTRLALEVARHHAGATFVNLAETPQADWVGGAIAQALGLLLTQAPLQEQLVQALRLRPGLLVLDNFEHLLDAAPLLSRLLAAVPQLQILVTSRQALGLQSEVVFNLSGLSLPQSDAPGEIMASEAVQLFVQSAQRRTAIQAHDGVFIARICQRVEGMPLALELAASWMGVLTPAQIDAHLQQGLELLSSQWRDLPPRHLSLRVVLEATFEQLTETHKRLLEALSLFRGGIALEAAQGLAGAKPSSLLELVSQSLLQREPSGRFVMHSLVQSYISERLQHSPQRKQTLEDQYTAYWSQRLVPWQSTTRQPAALAFIETELDNLRQALGFALKQHHYDRIELLIKPLRDFWDVRGRLQEALPMFRQAWQSLPPQAPASLQALLLRYQGQAALWLGLFEQAKQALQDALLLQAHEGAEELRLLGVVAYQTGQAQEALALLQQAHARSIPQSLQWAECLNVMGLVCKHLGHYPQAQQHFTQALMAHEQSGHLEGAAIALNNLANLAEAQGDNANALALYQKALAVFERMNHRQAIAVLTTNLGYVAFKLGQLPEARAQSLRSLELKQTLGHRRGMVVTLINLGEIETSPNPAAAKAYLLQAMRLGLEVGALPLVLEALCSLAVLLPVSQAVRLWDYVHRHEATTPEVRLRAQQLLSERQPAEPESQSLQWVVKQLELQL